MYIGPISLASLGFSSFYGYRPTQNINLHLAYEWNLCFFSFKTLPIKDKSISLIAVKLFTKNFILVETSLQAGSSEATSANVLQTTQENLYPGRNKYAPRF